MARSSRNKKRVAVGHPHEKNESELLVAGQGRDGLRPTHELVVCKITNGLDVERSLQMLGVASGNALQCINRGIGDFGKGLALICLVNELCNISHSILRLLPSFVSNGSV